VPRHDLTDKGPRYATVGDYLRVMRRRKLLIALIVVGSIGLALAVSFSQKTEYTADAQVSFRDPLQDLVLIGQGGQVFPDVSPFQRATIQAELLTRPKIARLVREDLDTDLDAETLADAVVTEVDPQTNLVNVQAVWGEPEFASKLANAFADQATRVGEAEARDRLREAENALQEDLRDAQKQRPLPGIRISIIEGNLQRLRGLQTITESAEVISTAEVPESPTSPQTVRNGVLGAILGLVVAIIAAFVRDSTDRRLHSAEDVHNELGFPILGRVGFTSFAYSGLVSSNGRGPLNERDFEAFRMLRMNLAFLDGERPPRSVLVTSPLAEEGKTTVSIALASAAALAGTKVLLVECDLRRPSFSKRLGIERAPGLADYLQGSAAPADILRVVGVTPPAPLVGEPPPQASDSSESMVVIPAGASVTNAAELLQGKRFDSFLDKITRAYELVILDCGPLLSVADPLELVAEAEAVLLCVRVQQTTRDQLHAARSALSHLPDRPCGVVVTGLRPGDETYDYYGY
jgi:Mrp family chromosome partitioning ATPase/capsular polysaccharide biosynthesis protein